MQPCFHPMSFVLTNESCLQERTSRSLSWTACGLSLCLGTHQKTVSQKTVGRYPYAPDHVPSFEDKPWAIPPQKSRDFACGSIDQPVAGGTFQPGSTGLRLKGPGTARTTQGGGETDFERSSDRWFRLRRICRTSQLRPTAMARDCSMGDTRAGAWR